MPTYVHRCPDHGRFEDRRSMADYDRPTPCPACLTPAPRVLEFDPARQLLVHGRFMTNFDVTGFKGFYGGGDWQTMTRDYHRWDSDFTGPLPDNHLHRDDPRG